MKEETNRFLTETMGTCWHDYDEGDRVNTYSIEAFVCRKCKGFILGNNDFSVAEDFTRLWAWAQKDDRLHTLVSRYRGEDFADREEGQVKRESFVEEACGLLKGGERP
jgi:hypothetical protein